MRKLKESDIMKDSKKYEEDSTDKHFEFCERLISKKDISINKKELETYTRNLISIYDNVYCEINLRKRAALVISKLAESYDMVLNLVIDNARQYAIAQYIDDASPYNPNSFDVLAKVGKGNKKIISFLKNTVQNNWGIPRWQAIETLCKLNDSTADRIIIEIVQGKYPPKILELESDLHVIENIKGKNFIQNIKSRSSV